MYFTAGARVRAEKLRLLKRQVSPAVLRELRRHPQLMDLTAQTRTMTFLVCRIRGFDTIAESFAGNPQGLSQLVRRAITPLVRAVHAHGGTVNRMVEGGLSAFFNAPLDDPNHAVHGCECALAMLETLDDVNRALASVPSEPIGIGIGINTGRGIVGDFGTAGQPDYAAMGPAAGWADTLERLSSDYGAAILAGNAVRAQAERSFAFLEVDLVPAGQNKPLPLFALLGKPLSRASPKFLALKSFHEHMFEAYRAQHWNEARALLVQARALSGANAALYDLYLQRIAHYEAHPPAANWNGIFTPAQS